ncbi:hypothetical protein D9758_011661 [Tetrapyrgos nigripes]|uniref:Uncharacterized protein n=1 Tax=Tetrapyrgos nigripes TaxID=182062 RepID=A0A8H5CTI6_9AGAR|nr:hypothetical protein D9758_011661 [Tetrapyrgos nigripes]
MQISSRITASNPIPEEYSTLSDEYLLPPDTVDDNIPSPSISDSQNTFHFDEPSLYSSAPYPNIVEPDLVAEYDDITLTPSYPDGVTLECIVECEAIAERAIQQLLQDELSELRLTARPRRRRRQRDGIDMKNIVEGKRTRRLPPRLDNFEHVDDVVPDDESSLTTIPIPEPPIPTPPIPTPPHNSHSVLGPVPPALTIRKIKTSPNKLGLYRIFNAYPLHDPDSSLEVFLRAESNVLSNPDKRPTRKPDHGLGNLQRPSFFPFLNKEEFRLMEWYYTSKSLSATTLTTLVKVLKDNFDVSKVPDNFDAGQVNKRLDAYISARKKPLPSLTSPEADPECPPYLKYGWKCSSVSIPLPCKDFKYPSEDDAPTFEVKNIWHRDIIDVIMSELQSSSFGDHHLCPHTLMWNPGDGDPEQRVYGEAYTSNRALEIEEEIFSSLPSPSDSSIENVPLYIMLWSDSTHLAEFGSALLWPIYLFFGNISKYIRGSSSNHTVHHLAYIREFFDPMADLMPQVPKKLKEHYREIYKRDIPSELWTHFKRELFQAIWRLLFTKQVKEAYKSGVIVKCSDAQTRRFFLRWFTYSKDYPERCLMLCTKNQGHFEVHEMGTAADMDRRKQKRVDNTELWEKVADARRELFVNGKPITSQAVRKLMDPESLVPTHNAFTEAFNDLGFQLFKIDPNNLCHEFDIGEFHRVFIHLVRILEAAKNNMRSIVDQRRGYSHEKACCIELRGSSAALSHDEIVKDLLWDLLAFHAYAKLRMHTDSTVASLAISMRVLGHSLRQFAKVTCPAFDTKELKEEAAACIRRAEKAAQKLDTSEALQKPKVLTSKSPLKRHYNLNTPKLHALGYYATDIPEFGTTDSHTTMIGEAEHTHSKDLYQRTAKSQFEGQIANLTGREQLIRDIADQNGLIPLSKFMPVTIASASTDSDLEAFDPTSPYWIGISEKERIDLDAFLSERRQDTAFKGFMRKLKDHLLGQLFSSEHCVEYSDEEHHTILIENESIFHHQTARFNYTSYDVRQCSDTVNPRTHPHVLALSGEGGHPYCYARVIHIFHIYARHRGPKSSDSLRIHKFYVLFVRWFDFDSETPWGFKVKRLPRVYFPHSGSPDAFGFLDPERVIRGVHIMPVYTSGQTDSLLSPTSKARQMESGDEGKIETLDWREYYIGIAADRDLFMRFRGGAVGHKSTRKYT